MPPRYRPATSDLSPSLYLSFCPNPDPNPDPGPDPGLNPGLNPGPNPGPNPGTNQFTETVLGKRTHVSQTSQRTGALGIST